jgi:phospholipid/cholesterol/gamma-HCH transport system substrate-binding protein
MERHANYALVGIVSMAIFVGLIAFVVWLAGFSVNRHYELYDIVFIGPVRGLSEGGEVHFNGIKVGEVTKIALDAKDPNRVIARARLTADVPVRVDSYATLEPQGITGVNYVQITAGTVSKPLLKAVTPRDQVPVIHSQKSALADLLEGGGTVLQRTVEALDRVNKLLSDDNIKSLSATIKDVQSMADELRERRAIIADAQRALQSIDKTAQAITELSNSSNRLVNGDAKRAISNMADAAEEIKATSKQAHAVIDKLAGPTGDFATTGLPELTAAVQNLQRTSKSLDELMSEVRQNPRGLISKAPAQEIEVKP